MQIREAERHPLDRREKELVETKEPGRSKREDETGQHCTCRCDAGPSRQLERAEAAQHARQQGDEVHREDRVVRQSQDRRRQNPAANQVLGVGEGAVKRREDVGVEDGERLVDDRVRIPRQRPQKQIGIRADGEYVTGRVPDERIRQQDGERGVEHRDMPRAQRVARRHAGGVHPAGATLVLWLDTHCQRPDRSTNTSTYR